MSGGPGPDSTVERDDAFYREALRATASQTAGAVGDAYFRTLVASLGESFGVRAVFVAEFSGSGTRVRQLARWVNGKLTEPREFDTSITPCRDVLCGKVTHYREGVSEQFPRERGYVSYLGLPLLDENEVVLGHLALLDSKPFDTTPETWVVLQTFAARAGVELARKRNRQLLESTLDSVMDAVILVNCEHHVTLANPSAERMFARGADAMRGRPVTDLLAPSLAARFERDARRLQHQQPAAAEAMVPAWSSGKGLALRADGTTFAVQFTLSPTAFGGAIFVTLVLRDVQERHDLEARLTELGNDNAALEGALGDQQGELLGDSAPMRQLRHEIAQVGPTDATVLITGETGTGKELVASAVHQVSRRQTRRMVKLNCATLPRELIESELFGHEKGAFTGAIARKRGRFELAHDGTLFLDEVGELSLEAQAKLLRVLQEGELERLGSEQPISINVRVIAATNRDLGEMVTEGAFRSDLYYRLAVFPLTVPPLRERNADIEPLALAFLRDSARRIGKDVLVIEPASLEQLRGYAWPGNVRELQNAIERAVILASTSRVTVELAGSQAAMAARPASAGDTLDDVQRVHIERVLQRTGGVIDGPGGAAARLAVHPNTLRSRMKRLGVARP